MRSELSNSLHLIWPANLQFVSVSLQRAGWFAVLRCDDSWKDDTGQSLYGMAGTGKSEDGPQPAINAAVMRIEELVAEINREIPLRKENRPRKTPSQEADEIFALLGL